MTTLKRIEADAQLVVPREVGIAIKALANDERHRLAWQFLIEDLCGRHRLSYVPDAPDARDLMLHREGRRYVGEWLTRIAETPIPEAEPAEPPARTMTERVRRAHRS